MTTATYDPYAAAMTATPAKPLDRTLFGEVVIVDCWACMLIKGQGKVPFDPTIHDASKAASAIEITIEVERQDGTVYDVSQKTVNFAKDWALTLRSLQKVSKTLMDIKGAFVQFKRRPTGEKYEKTDGSGWADRTGIVIEAVFPNKATMEAAREAFYGQFAKPAAPADPQAMEDAIASVRKAPPVAPTISIDRQAAADMIDLLWKMAGNDKPKFVDMLRAQPLLAEFHKLDQPEVIKHIGELYDHGIRDDLPF